LDLIDEAPLTALQMREVVQLIAGEHLAGVLPSVTRESWQSFEQSILLLNAQLGLVWDPIRKVQSAFVFLNKTHLATILSKAYTTKILTPSMPSWVLCGTYMAGRGTASEAPKK
jgi:hypothetical protein